MDESDRLWSLDQKAQSIGTLEKLFEADKTFVITIKLLERLEEMTMHERAFKVMQEAIAAFDGLYGTGHPKKEEMYATLVMNIYETATKLGQPEIAKKHLEEGLTKCTERKFLDTFSHHLEKLTRP